MKPNGLAMKIVSTRTGEVWTRVINSDTGDVFFPSPAVANQDVQSYLAEVARLRKAYSDAVHNNEYKVSDIVPVHISPKLQARGDNFMKAVEEFKKANAGKHHSAANGVVTAFWALQRETESLRKQIPWLNS